MDDAPEGYFASGDEAADKANVDEINARLDSGDLWAWCVVRVVAKWKGYRGDDVLGACSYQDEADFIRCDDYYRDMCNEALANLNARVQEDAATLSLLAT